VVLGGCGFNAAAAIDGGTHDGSGVPDMPGGGSDGSGSDAGGTATDCLQHWLDGNPVVSAGQELTALSSSGTDRDPWISADGLRLYFGRNPGSQGLSDIYLATRTTTAQNFGSANAVVNLDRSDSDESRAALSGDEKTLVMSSNRPPPVAPPPAPKFDIYITTRNDVTKDFGTPSPNDPRVTALNADAGNHLDPFLTADGLKLYLAPNTAGGNRQEIRLATRATPADNFGGSAPVTELNVLTSSADPALSLDERIVVFTGRTGNQTTELYYATRATATGSFGTPVKIPTVNSNDNDADPMLSADGCELYFASDRDGGGKYHLFHATVTK
jgi:hypothetical protein